MKCAIILNLQLVRPQDHHQGIYKATTTSQKVYHKQKKVDSRRGEKQNHTWLINRISKEEDDWWITIPTPVVCIESHSGPITPLRTSTLCAWCALALALRRLTCQVFDIGNGWRTRAAARLCYQAPGARAACSGALLPQSPLTDTPGVPAQPTLGRKAYVLSVLEHQHSPRRGETTC